MASSMHATDLTGLWSGVYHYPAGMGDAVGFTAIITQSGAQLSGSITERSDLGDGYERADILGDVADGHVYFTKLYDDSGAYGHSVDYRGQVNDAGSEITGLWHLTGLSGQFYMWREIHAQLAAESEMETRLPELIKA